MMKNLLFTLFTLTLPFYLVGSHPQHFQLQDATGRSIMVNYDSQPTGSLKTWREIFSRNNNPEFYLQVIKNGSSPLEIHYSPSHRYRECEGSVIYRIPNPFISCQAQKRNDSTLLPYPPQPLPSLHPQIFPHQYPYQNNSIVYFGGHPASSYPTFAPYNTPTIPPVHFAPDYFFPIQPPVPFNPYTNTFDPNFGVYSPAMFDPHMTYSSTAHLAVEEEIEAQKAAETARQENEKIKNALNEATQCVTADHYTTTPRFIIRTSGMLCTDPAHPYNSLYMRAYQPIVSKLKNAQKKYNELTASLQTYNQHPIVLPEKIQNTVEAYESHKQIISTCLDELKEAAIPSNDYQINMHMQETMAKAHQEHNEFIAFLETQNKVIDTLSAKEIEQKFTEFKDHLRNTQFKESLKAQNINPEALTKKQTSQLYAQFKPQYKKMRELKPTRFIIYLQARNLRIDRLRPEEIEIEYAQFNRLLLKETEKKYTGINAYLHDATLHSTAFPEETRKAAQALNIEKELIDGCLDTLSQLNDSYPPARNASPQIPLSTQEKERLCREAVEGPNAQKYCPEKTVYLTSHELWQQKVTAQHNLIEHSKARIAQIEKQPNYEKVTVEGREYPSKAEKIKLLREELLNKEKKLQDLHANEPRDIILHNPASSTAPTQVSAQYEVAPVSSQNESQPTTPNLSEEEQKAEKKARKKERLNQQKERERQEKAAAAELKKTQEAAQKEAENKKQQTAQNSTPKTPKPDKQIQQTTQEERAAKKAAEAQALIDAEAKKALQKELDRQTQREKEKQKREAAEKEKEKAEEKRKAYEKRKTEERAKALKDYAEYAKTGNFNAIRQLELLTAQEVDYFKINAANVCLVLRAYENGCVKAGDTEAYAMKTYLEKIAADKNSDKEHRRLACTGLSCFKNDSKLMNFCYKIGNELKDPSIILQALNTLGHTPTMSDKEFATFSQRLRALEKEYGIEKLQQNYLYYHTLYLEKVKQIASLSDLEKIIKDGLERHPDNIYLKRTLTTLPNENDICGIRAYKFYQGSGRINDLNLAEKFLAEGNPESEDNKEYKKMVQQEQEKIKKNGKKNNRDGSNLLYTKETVDHLRNILLRKVSPVVEDTDYEYAATSLYSLITRNPHLTNNLDRDLTLCYHIGLIINNLPLQLDALHQLVMKNRTSENVNQEFWTDAKDKLQKIESTYQPDILNKQKNYFYIKLYLCDFNGPNDAQEEVKHTTILQEALRYFPEDPVLTSVQKIKPNKNDIKCEELYKKYLASNNIGLIQDAYKLLKVSNPHCDSYKYHKDKIEKLYIIKRYLDMPTMHLVIQRELLSEEEQTDFLQLLATACLPSQESAPSHEKLPILSATQLAQLLENPDTIQNKEGYVQYFRVKQELVLRKNRLRHTQEREELICEGLERFPNDKVLNILLLNESMPMPEDINANKTYKTYIQQGKKSSILLAIAQGFLEKGNPDSLTNKKLQTLLDEEKAKKTAASK